MINKDLIFLIGFMGSGKSTIGKLLAEKLHFDFIDTDTMIEQREDMTIKAIFDKYGEDYFRDLEAVLLKEVSQRTKAVVSTGGGMPIYHNNIGLMNQHGTSIYLSLAANRIVERLENNDKRPLLQKKTSKEVADMLNLRRSIYLKADFTVMAFRPPKAVTDRICALLKF